MPYSSRELTSIDIYLYHAIHKQYRLNTTSNDTTTIRNHNVLTICIVHIGQHTIRCTRHTILTWYNVVQTEEENKGIYCLFVLYDTVHMSCPSIGIIYNSSSSKRWQRQSVKNIRVVLYPLDNKYTLASIQYTHHHQHTNTQSIIIISLYVPTPSYITISN